MSGLTATLQSQQSKALRRIDAYRRDPRFAYEFTVPMTEPHYVDILRWVTSSVPRWQRVVVTAIWETHVFLQRSKDAVHLRLRWGETSVWQVPR